MSISNVILDYNIAWSNTDGTITALEKYNPPQIGTSPFILVGTASGNLYRFWDGDSNGTPSVQITLDPSINTPITGISVSPDGVVMFINTCGHCYRYAGEDIGDSNITTITATQDIYTGNDNTGGVTADTEEFVYLVAENGNAIYYFNDYGSTGKFNILYRYPVPNVLQLGDLDFNAQESKLFVTDKYSGNIYSYDFENETGNLQTQVALGGGSGVNSMSFDNDDNLFFNYPTSNIVNGFINSNNTILKVAGGTEGSTTDPLLQQLNNPRCVLSVSSGLYISSDVSGGVGSQLFRITFNFIPRNAPVVPAPQFKQVNCGIASPGNCKRAIVPFNPREYWRWGSPNRPYLTPDPNISCVPSLVFQLCPTIPLVVQPIPPPPPIPIPVVPTVITEIATNQFNTRRTGRSGNIQNLTNISEITGIGNFRTAPAFGPQSEIYAINTSGVIYRFDTSAGTLFNSPTILYNLGRPVTASSPSVANTGALVVATNNGDFYRFNSNGNVLWQKTTGKQVFGSPGCFTNSNASVDNVFFTAGNTLYNYEASTGDLIWSKTLAGSETYRSSVYVGSLIVVGSGLGGSVYAYRRTDGTLVWKYPSGTSTFGIPVTSTPNLIGSNYIFGAGSNLYALTSNGLLVWTTTVSGNIQSSPAVTTDSTGRIWSFFTTTCNVLYGIRKNTTGFTTWKSIENVDENCSPTLDISTGGPGPYVYGYNSNGQVFKYIAQYTAGATQSAVATFTASGQIDCKSLISSRQNRMFVFTLSDTAYRIR
jgi:outer membrane protein assembly factor BamB/sugar lactone lactonase YvrE